MHYEDQHKRIFGESGQESAVEQMADPGEASLLIGRELQRFVEPACEANERAARAALCEQPPFFAADISSDGCRGQGRGDPARDVGIESAGLPGVQFQGTKPFRTGA